ncbi:MAG: hypothetical protein JNM52_04195 [Betaproteobacteria bacterium]|nr:hypothetical protein [Betaproteobacteria bacterium]
MNISAHPVTLPQCVAMLEARRQLICEELNQFARPIAACDADFNTLLAERAEIVLALSRLQPYCRGEARIPHPRDDR